jgi:hypothetical protein
MRSVVQRAVPVFLLGSFALLAGCEREPPPELVAEIEALDLRETQEIVLPHQDRAYRVVSRHNPDLLDADEQGGARFRGGVIRITDPGDIVRASRFLILMEDER